MKSEKKKKSLPGHRPLPNVVVNATLAVILFGMLHWDTPKIQRYYYFNFAAMIACIGMTIWYVYRLIRERGES